MNLFTQFMTLLKVKHSKTFSDRYYGEHPYKYTLYGTSQMLSNYQIPNAGLQLNDKEEIISLQTPFIAQVSNDFVLVTKLYGDSIEYIWRAKKLNTTISEFKTIWTGVVLLAEPDEDSKEPEYSKHIVKERFVITEKIIIAVFILTLSCALF